jgi:hypothetical protein
VVKFDGESFNFVVNGDTPTVNENSDICTALQLQSCDLVLSGGNGDQRTFVIINSVTKRDFEQRLRNEWNNQRTSVFVGATFFAGFTFDSAFNSGRTCIESITNTSFTVDVNSTHFNAVELSGERSVAALVVHLPRSKPVFQAASHLFGNRYPN